jgi:hypothetical protein
MTRIRILCLVMLVLIVLCQFSQAASMIPEKKIASLKEGRHRIGYTQKAPNKGLSIREFKLKPVKETAESGRTLRKI